MRLAEWIEMWSPESPSVWTWREEDSLQRGRQDRRVHPIRPWVTVTWGCMGCRLIPYPMKLTPNLPRYIMSSKQWRAFESADERFRASCANRARGRAPGSNRTAYFINTAALIIGTVCLRHWKTTLESQDHFDFCFPHHLPMNPAWPLYVYCYLLAWERVPGS